MLLVFLELKGGSLLRERRITAIAVGCKVEVGDIGGSGILRHFLAFRVEVKFHVEVKMIC